MRFAIEDFFPTSRFTQERTKIKYQRATSKRSTRFAVEFFLSYELLKSRKQRIFFADKLHTRASMGKPRKPLSPPGLVYCHKKGTWERKEKKRRHKKGTWETQEKEKKRKRPRKARRWLQQKQGSVCPTPRIPFFGSRVFGLGSSPSRLKYRLLRDLVYEEAMCGGSSRNGLLYAAKRVP